MKFWHDLSVSSSRRNCHSCIGPEPVGDRERSQSHGHPHTPWSSGQMDSPANTAAWIKGLPSLWLSNCGWWPVRLEMPLAIGLCICDREWPFDVSRGPLFACIPWYGDACIDNGWCKWLLLVLWWCDNWWCTWFTWLRFTWCCCCCCCWWWCGEWVRPVCWWWAGGGTVAWPLFELLLWGLSSLDHWSGDGVGGTDDGTVWNDCS